MALMTVFKKGDIVSTISNLVLKVKLQNNELALSHH